MTKIFMSYRRADSASATTSVRLLLERYYRDDDIFQDYESIPPGDEFWPCIEGHIKAANVQLVMIGPRWLTEMHASGGRRIDHPDDWVAREVALGLETKTVRVIPVFVDGANPDTVLKADPLPARIQSLMSKNGRTLRGDSLEGDVKELVGWIGRKRYDPRDNPRIYAGIGAAVLALGIAIAIPAMRSSGSDTVISQPTTAARAPLQVHLAGPTGLFEDRVTGDLYITDTKGNWVYKRSPDGSIVAVAGRGESKIQAFSESGVATDLYLYRPAGIVSASDGVLWFADHGIIRFLSNGRIATGAGIYGHSIYDGDGEAVQRSINPNMLAIGPDDSIYFSDTDNHLVRVLQGGRFRTLAGVRVDEKPVGGFNGEDGVGTAIKLNRPYGVAIDAHDNLYIADTENNRVRKLSLTTHKITTVAGGGTSSADGPALQVALDNPTGVTVAPDGSVYISEYAGNRVRKLSVDGLLTTVAGKDSATCKSGDRPDSSCTLQGPNTVLAAADGSGIYISEYVGHKVRKLDLDGKLTLVQG